MVTSRMQGDQRRVSIIDAAVPLFARRGFDGTTTKEIASAAAVSEALLFKHFPTKAILYREIIDLGCMGDPALELLTTMQPCTRTLVQVTCGMIRHFMSAETRDDRDCETKLRLVNQSLLGDGEYARSLFAWVIEAFYPTFEASFAAAVAAGDIALAPVDPRNAFWFAQHVASTMAMNFLPGESCVPYDGDVDALSEQAARFVLRGMGMPDDTITAELAAVRDHPFFCASQDQR